LPAAVNFRLHILGSSSSGNSGLLVTPTARILIDAGFSARRIKKALAAVGENIEDLDAVFITHEHSDHCEGIAGLARLKRPVFFANQDTARAVQAGCEKAEPRWKIFETGSSFEFLGVKISAFSIPHDAADPVGYTFTVDGPTPEAPSQILAWVTDLGYAPQLVREKIKYADCLVLESNYDAAMLERSTRPPSLKQRIKGRHGHLSNDLAQEVLMTLGCERLRHVFLAHLSRECNHPDLVDAALAPVRLLHPQCVFSVISPEAMEPLSL
jgi:phosphoribosyl 1,2-cyclic phosphodiesterase